MTEKKMKTRIATALLLPLATAACDSIIEVKLGDRVEESTLEGPDAAPLLGACAAEAHYG